MDGLSVLDSGMDIKKYLAEKGLSPELLCKTESNDILILPTCYSPGEYYYAQESIDFVKFCREVDKDVKVDILDFQKILYIHLIFGCHLCWWRKKLCFH